MKKCTACTSLGQDTLGPYRDFIYQNGSEVSTLNLCYRHSVELFKTGQFTFVLKYRPESVDYEDPQKDFSNRLSNYFVLNSLR